MLKERLQAIWDRMIPVRKVTVYNTRHEPSALAQSLDVDTVHSILREAESGNTERLFSLYRDIILADNHIQAEFAKRKLAVLGDPLNIAPFEKKNQLDILAATAVDLMFQDFDGLRRAWSHLLDATLYPVAVLEKVYAPSNIPGLRFELVDLVPVPYQLFDYTEGCLRIFDTDPKMGNRLGTSHEATADRYIIHRGHLLSSPDNWGGPMRSIIFWWLLSAMDRDWWARFLERFGAPFLKGKYDPADESSKSILERAFSNATRLFGVVISQDTEVDLVQASASQSGDAYEKFHAICQREKSKLIVGQTLSSEAQSTGMGSGVAKGQENVRNDIRQFDAAMLGETVRNHLLKQFLKINGFSGRAPRLTWAAESTEAAQLTGTLLASLNQAGLRVSDGALPVLSEKVGFEIERAPAPVQPPGGLFSAPAYFSAGIPKRVAMADSANEGIATEGSAALALAFRGSLAPVRRLIEESTGPDDLERKIRAFYADWSPARVAPIVEEALLAYAANGSSVHSR